MLFCKKNWSISGRTFNAEYKGATGDRKDENVMNLIALFCKTLILDRFCSEDVPHPKIPYRNLLSKSE